eukprot:SAG11_NODE_273_length_11315_cov_38.599412_6_plen_132_part_00
MHYAGVIADLGDAHLFEDSEDESGGETSPDGNDADSGQGNVTPDDSESEDSESGSDWRTVSESGAGTGLEDSAATPWNLKPTPSEVPSSRPVRCLVLSATQNLWHMVAAGSADDTDFIWLPDMEKISLRFV